MHFPNELQDLFRDVFFDLENRAYCQVATVDNHGQPWVRTVHVRWVKDRDQLGFVTNTDSPKWQQLVQHPKFSFCYYVKEKELQIRVHGEATCVDGSTDNANDAALVQKWWQKTRPTVRKLYWLEHVAKNSIQTKVTDFEPLAPTYGAVLLDLNRIEIMNYYENAYDKSKRTAYIKQNGQWHKKQLAVVSSTIL